MIQNCLLALTLLSIAPSSALAQEGSMPARRLGARSTTEPAAGLLGSPAARSTMTLAARSMFEPSPPSPGWERGMLLIAGGSLGTLVALLGGLLVALITLPPCDGCGYGPLVASLVAIPSTAMVTIPLGVFLFGNLSGRGAEFGWTLLGTLLGVLPGAALITVGAFVDDGDDRDASGFYAGGGVVAGLGAIAGAIIAFELSSRPGAARVAAGPGSLTLAGSFD